MLVKRLNDKGIARAQEYIYGLENKKWPVSSMKKDVLEILEDVDCTENLSIDIEVDEVPPTFENRSAMAEYLHAKLGVMSSASVRSDKGLWAWWGLYLIEDTVNRSKKDGRIKLREIDFHMPGNRMRFHRQLVYSSWRALEDFGEFSKVFTISWDGKKNTNVHGEISEQFLSNQRLASPIVVEMVYRLYFDENNGRPRAGISGKGLGSTRRFNTFLKSIDLTYDLHSISLEKMIDLLPSEFDMSVPV